MESSAPSSQNTVSYASVVNDQPISKEQAIVLDAVDGHSIRDYTYAVAKVTESTNMLYVSRISHSRILIILNSKECASKLVDSKATVNIGTHTLAIRPLISKAKRVIISNVSPFIPRSLFEAEIAKLNITLRSKITSIRAGINDPGFSHILSIRKQMYIDPEDVSKLPEAISITHDNTTYWIYFSTEKLTCFLCKEEGHTSRYCKNNVDNSVISSPKPDHLMLQDTLHENSLEIAQQNNTQVENDMNISMPPPTTGGIKRPPSSSISSKSIISDEAVTLLKNNEIKDKKAYVSKKARTSPPPLSISEIDFQLQPAKDFIQNNIPEFPLDYTKFLDFVTKSHGPVTNVLETATNATENPTALYDMLGKVYPYLNDRRLKTRFTNIRKKLRKVANIVDDVSSIEAGSTDEADCADDKEPTKL